MIQAEGTDGRRAAETEAYRLVGRMLRGRGGITITEEVQEMVLESIWLWWLPLVAWEAKGLLRSAVEVNTSGREGKGRKRRSLNRVEEKCKLSEHLGSEE